MKNKQNTSIGWINGDWGPINQLSIPLTDRGLTVGDGIFETILIYEGKAWLLSKHLGRWQRSASILNMAPPPSENWLKPLIEEAIKRTYLQNEPGALRLNWSRGNCSGQGIALSATQANTQPHRFWLELNAIFSNLCGKNLKLLIDLIIESFFKPHILQVINAAKIFS